MSRYFLELTYRGTRYSGFQVQDNANTVQSEVEKALSVLLRTRILCTGSSRTDAGVHSRQNYFHFDFTGEIKTGMEYRLNAILPADIAVRSLRKVHPEAHCRFDAIARRYEYVLHEQKDPFLEDRAWFYPYPLEQGVLEEVAGIVLNTTDFTSFAKRNSQVNNFSCEIRKSVWCKTATGWVYLVEGNRFLRGMVRGLVGTMLQAGRGNITVERFKEIIISGDNQQADFSAPGRGLFLEAVIYRPDYFIDQDISS
ncbi:MAG: tRNA pseudouridine(38-40) synthase TruA [Chitinophagaceae bacterium]